MEKGEEDRKDVQFFYGDVRDSGAVGEAIYHSDGVIHLAGVLGTQETVKNSLSSIETNILGSLNIFESCAHHNKKGVYIVVGNYWMNNSYSITKTTAERFALMYNKKMGTKIAVVRGLNAYGARQKDKPVRKITPNFILPALKNEKILDIWNKPNFKKVREDVLKGNFKLDICKKCVGLKS